jgi:hypothetical protein
MKPSKPPAAATWMLEHLLPGVKNEALAGDLLEEFQRRRSTAWYWRQVFGAISASLLKEVRADWLMVWTIVFSIVWAYGLYLFPFVGHPLPVSVLVGIGLVPKKIAIQNSFAMPITLNYVLPVLFQTAVPLSVYLAGAGNLKFRAITRGICAGVLAMLVLRYLPGQGVLDFLVLHGLAYYWVQLWKGYEVMLQFIPLVAAMWVARYRRKVSGPGVMVG